jgi:hypothetical protein
MGSSTIFAAPPPFGFALSPRLHLPGHHRLPALADLNMLVDVLHHRTWAPHDECGSVSPERERQVEA